MHLIPVILFALSGLAVAQTSARPPVNPPASAPSTPKLVRAELAKSESMPKTTLQPKVSGEETKPEEPMPQKIRLELPDLMRLKSAVNQAGGELSWELGGVRPEDLVVPLIESGIYEAVREGEVLIIRPSAQEQSLQKKRNELLRQINVLQKKVDSNQ